MKTRVLILAIAVALNTGALFASGDESLKHFNNALVLYKVNDLDGAVQELQKSLTYNPNDSLVRLKLAGILSEEGQWKEALNQYTETAKIDTNDAFLYI